MAACRRYRSAAAQPCGIAAASRRCRSGGVLVRRHDQPPRAFFSTCPDDRAADIVSAYIQRWSIETTFEESRAHLGFETQRQWSDVAIERTTPCLLSLYSLVTLLAQDLYLDGRLMVRKSAWYAKQQATFSDALAAVRQHLWEEPLAELRIRVGFSAPCQARG